MFPLTSHQNSGGVKKDLKGLASGIDPLRLHWMANLIRIQLYLNGTLWLHSTTTLQLQLQIHTKWLHPGALELLWKIVPPWKVEPFSLNNCVLYWVMDHEVATGVEPFSLHLMEHLCLCSTTNLQLQAHMHLKWLHSGAVELLWKIVPLWNPEPFFLNNQVLYWVTDHETATGVEGHFGSTFFLST